MADYSEFPTTPTRWQENLWPEPITTPETESPPPPRRRVDPVSLVAGVFFAVLGLLMAGVDLSFRFWEDGGFVWLLLIGGGIALLVSELKKSRRRRS